MPRKPRVAPGGLVYHVLNRAAGLVTRAEDWPWSSLWARRNGGDDLKALLTDWPIPRPPAWLARVNAPITPRELQRLGLSESRGRPYGADAWVARTVTQLGLQHTIRNEGRPRKEKRNAPAANN